MPPAAIFFLAFLPLSGIVFVALAARPRGCTAMTSALRQFMCRSISHLADLLSHSKCHAITENEMKRFVSRLSAAVAVIGSTFLVSPATAGPATDALTICVADNTTGKDRKDLAQWIFVAMAAHPEIQPFSNIAEGDRDEFDKRMAALATKLITENCRVEAKSAAEKEGSESFNAAFGVLGQLAMQELMSNPAVKSSFFRYTRFLDKAKFDSAFAK